MIKICLYLLILYLIGACKGIQNEHAQTLLTSNMEEAKLDFVQGDKALPIVIGARLASGEQDRDDTIPWANVFYCITGINDTIVVLDTRLNDPKVNFDEASPWAEIEETNKYNVCKINVSEDELRRIRKLKYRYAKLTIVLDD